MKFHTKPTLGHKISSPSESQAGMASRPRIFFFSFSPVVLILSLQQATAPVQVAPSARRHKCCCDSLLHPPFCPSQLHVRSLNIVRWKSKCIPGGIKYLYWHKQDVPSEEKHGLRLWLIWCLRVRWTVATNTSSQMLSGWLARKGFSWFVVPIRPEAQTFYSWPVGVRLFGGGLKL